MTIEDYKAGQVLLVDKTKGISSFDVIRILRRGLRGVKMGHAGTLDPLATGLLIICTGKFTKKIDQYQGMEKEYEGHIEIGSSTPSYDKETEANEKFETAHITNDLLQQTVKKFIGTIEQYPPKNSAIRVGGKRAYKLVRQGKEVKMSPRIVEIVDFELLNDNIEHLNFRVKCSKGTYIRSLANDFGKALGSGAHLASLRRTAIGEFRVENAKTPDEWLEQFRSMENIDDKA
ncbi:MAG: tRNA pseudouridine(55) synthase TruB [Bacteroidia bacterium]|nr:tRNA pseudouridine(55) synthase TruB [Bacteroidia bacterium]